MKTPTMDDVLLDGGLVSGAFNPLRGQASERTLHAPSEEIQR